MMVESAYLIIEYLCVQFHLFVSASLVSTTYCNVILFAPFLQQGGATLQTQMC